MNSTSTTDGSCEPSLRPLFNNPQQWFNSVSYEYHMLIGEKGSVYDLTPNGITFKHTHRVISHPQTRVKADEYRQTINNAETITLTQSETESTKINSPSGWVNTQGRIVKTYIHIPFEATITAENTLKQKLDNIFHTNPDFELLFNRLNRIPDSIQ